MPINTHYVHKTRVPSSTEPFHATEQEPAALEPGPGQVTGSVSSNKGLQSSNMPPCWGIKSGILLKFWYQWNSALTELSACSSRMSNNRRGSKLEFRSQHPYWPLKEKITQSNTCFLSPCLSFTSWFLSSDKSTQVKVTHDSTCLILSVLTRHRLPPLVSHERSWPASSPVESLPSTKCQYAGTIANHLCTSSKNRMTVKKITE